MASGKSGGNRPIEPYVHDDQERLNNPASGAGHTPAGP